MVVHSINIFDKKGKILFTKAYSPAAIKQERYLLESGSESGTGMAEPGSADAVMEQKKLIFGMLFSLRELVSSLTPEECSRKSLQSIKTSSATVHTYETLSGLRFALYTSNDVPSCKLSEQQSDYYSSGIGGIGGAMPLSSTAAGNLTGSSSTGANAVTTSSNNTFVSGSIFGRDALIHIYSNIWVECVVRSPLYSINVGGSSGGGGADGLMECIKSTTFEKELDSYLSSLSWY